MAKRKGIVLTFRYSENWIAGSYYVINIIKALNSLPDEEKPALLMLMDNRNGIELIKEVDYPYIRYVFADPNDDPPLTRYLRKISFRLFKTDRLLKTRLSKAEHIFEGGESYGFIPKHYYWVHDFQECRLPDFFSAEEAAARSALPKKVAQLESASLILSSKDALNDFNTFFPGYRCRVKVLRFASSLPDFSDIDGEAQKKAFGIDKPFFICSNQFWQHKNHRLVLEAVRLLKEKDLDFQVVFTGKNYDHRNPGYFSSLEGFVKEHRLEPFIRFLGFIDRKVQLSLADRSVAYIQPSLFEGWSTTVEDAKYLNKFVLLSDIPVHREQLDTNVAFFDPGNAADLAAKMETLLKTPPVLVKNDYTSNIRTFGRDLIDLFS